MLLHQTIPFMGSTKRASNLSSVLSMECQITQFVAQEVYFFPDEFPDWMQKIWPCSKIKEIGLQWDNHTCLEYLPIYP